MTVVRDEYAEARFRRDDESGGSYKHRNGHCSEDYDRARTVIGHWVAGVVLLDLHAVHEGCNLQRSEDGSVVPIPHEVRGYADERRHDEEMTPCFHEVPGLVKKTE